MTTQEFDATQVSSVTLGDSTTEFSDITFVQGSGLEGEPALTSLVITYGLDTTILTKYFTEEIVEGETEYVMTSGAVNTFNVGGKDYTLEWKTSNVFNDESAYGEGSSIYGNGGAMYNIITGNEDDQTIVAVSGIRNWINGGEGNQTIIGENPYDMLAGNEDNDIITASDDYPTEIYGGEGNDILSGSDMSDWIAGNEGNDTIYGGDGDDWLFGGDHTGTADPNGNDTIYGEDGNDKIYGRGGNDKLYGEDGDDSIYAGAGNDIIEGGQGNDTLTGGNGSDTFIFSKNDGSDIIADATSSDTIKFDKAIRFSDISFSQGTGQQDREPVTSLVIRYGNNDSINVQNYFTAENVVSDNPITSFNIEGKDYVLEWRQSATDGKYGMFSVIDGQNFQSPDGIKGMNIKSKTGNEIIRGSNYNDTIKISGGNNDITETLGTNKITLGKGNDIVNLSGLSSNTVKVGAGTNRITIDSTGTNKITAGNGSDIVNIDNGSNNIKLANGNNIVVIGDMFDSIGTSVNTITSGKDDDQYVIYNGSNKIKSGSGDDDFTISGGYNVINTGNGENDVTITDGINEIKSGKKQDTYTISDGQNAISSGSGNDFFSLTGGSNILNGGSGVDRFNVTDYGITQGEDSTLTLTKLNGGKGNDIYDIDETAYKNDLIQITDTSGKNSLIVNEQLDVYFDVKLGKGSKYSIGKELFFSDNFDSDDDGTFDTGFLNKGISVTGKNYKAITDITIDNGTTSTKYTFDVKTLASDVAGWLSANNFKSSADVLASGNETAIDNLLGVYAGTTEYTGSDQCYKGIGVA